MTERKQPTSDDGERYLQLLDLEELKERQLKTKKGIILAKNFLDICGPHALPVFQMLDEMGPEDPDYEEMRAQLHQQVIALVERYGV